MMIRASRRLGRWLLPAALLAVTLSLGGCITSWARQPVPPPGSSLADMCVRVTTNDSESMVIKDVEVTDDSLIGSRADTPTPIRVAVALADIRRIEAGQRDDAPWILGAFVLLLTAALSAPYWIAYLERT